MVRCDGLRAGSTAAMAKDFQPPDHDATFRQFGKPAEPLLDIGHGVVGLEVVAGCEDLIEDEASRCLAIFLEEVY